MSRLWKKRIPAFLLTLVMMVSLVPAALAEETISWSGGDSACSHTPIETGSRTKATCSQDGEIHYVCTTCQATGTERIPATGEHNYVLKSDSTQHWQECSDCGVKKDEATHSWEDQATLSPANCTSPAKKTQKCSVCGETQNVTTGDKDPTNHNVSANWETDGSSHYHPCANGCGQKNYEGSEFGSHRAKTFQTGKQYTSDANDVDHHWQVCEVCGEKYNSATHTNNDGDTLCDICGARVDATYKVNFQTYGGSSVATQNLKTGEYPKQPANPTRTDYAFKYWSKTSSSKPYNTGSDTTPPQVTFGSEAVGSTDITYYAIYTVAATGKNTSVAPSTNIGSSLRSAINAEFQKFFPYQNFDTVIFSSPSASSSGTLYASGTTEISSSSVYRYADVANMTFKSGGGTYSIKYRAYYSSSSSTENYVEGIVSITNATTSKILRTVNAGKSVSIGSTDFYNFFGSGLNYVVFSPSSDYTSYGAFYAGGKTFSTVNDVKNNYFYYGTSSSSSYSLSGLSFQASSSAKTGTLSIPFTAYGTVSSNTRVGTLEITVNGSASGDVEYRVTPGKTVDIRSSDFRDYLRKSYSGDTLDYVRFTSTTVTGGYFYHNYKKNGETRLSRLSGDFYYRPSNTRDYDLDELTFAADSSFKSDISFSFTAYSTSSGHTVSGKMVITSTDKSAKGDINYDVAPGKTVDFRVRDFRNFYEDNNTDNFSYVEFSRPGSSAFNNGTLYHNYDTNSSKSFNRDTIDDHKFYDYPSSSQYGIGNLTFVATSSFKEVITLDFTAYGDKGRSVNGTVTITSTESSSDGDVTFSVAPGKSVNLSRTAFNTYFRKTYNSTVSYVVFQRPGSSTIFNNGTLYCGYGTSSQTSFTYNSLGGTHFYYDKADMGRNDYYLDDLTFVASVNFKNAITLDFTAYGTASNDYVEGTLVIKPDGTAAALSNYTGSIRYTTITGTNVQINANDIARYFKSVYPSYALQYVTLNGVPTTGSLYYNYYNASSYGTTSRLQLTSGNCSAQNLYASPTSTAQYALTELTYVPSGSNYCASIPFTAYGSGGVSVTGTILISVSRAKVAEVYGVTPRNTAVTFPASSIYSAVLTATGSALSSIQLLSLPPVTSGTVYIGTGNDRADTRTAYTYASGAGQMSQLRFVPLASYTGSVEIPYVALDANGNALVTGSFSLGVLNNRKTLKDVTASTWCYKYVMELMDQNVISGYTDGSFKPNSTVTYGAALKLIMLAAGYPEQAPTGKNVFSGYLAKAQADGIVTRSSVNLAAPITRLQVAQLAAGALKLSTSGLSSVKPFTDTSDVYVQALNAAGIVEGYFNNGTSTYQPSKTLTRGQMSAIVWRMNEYRK